MLAVKCLIYKRRLFLQHDFYYVCAIRQRDDNREVYEFVEYFYSSISNRIGFDRLLRSSAIFDALFATYCLKLSDLK